MDNSLLVFLITLLSMLCVIIVVAYLHAGSRSIPKIPCGHPALTVQILMILKVM